MPHFSEEIQRSHQTKGCRPILHGPDHRVAQPQILVQAHAELSEGGKAQLPSSTPPPRGTERNGTEQNGESAARAHGNRPPRPAVPVKCTRAVSFPHRVRLRPHHSACLRSTPAALPVLDPTRPGASASAAAMREEVRSSSAAPPDPPPGRSASPPPTPVARYAAFSPSPFLSRPLGVRDSGLCVAAVSADPSALLAPGLRIGAHKGSPGCEVPCA